MKTFKDNTGHEWQIGFSIGSMKRIKTDSGFDLMDPEKDNLGARLASDIIYFWEALWHIVSPQAAVASVSAEEFGERMGPDCLVAAHDLFFAEWAKFFHQLRRPSVGTSIDKIHELKTRAAAILKKTLDEDQTLQSFPQQFADQLDAELHEQMAKLPAMLSAAMNDEMVNVKVTTPAQ